MTNILFVVRVKKRPEPDPGYGSRRRRSTPGEIEDWLPDGTHPGLAIIDNPEYRIIQVTGAGMTVALANTLIGTDVLSAQDLGKGFAPRWRTWRIDYTQLPAAVLSNLRNRLPFAQRGTIYDMTFTAAAINNFLNAKAAEARDANGLPVEDNETPIAEI